MVSWLNKGYKIRTVVVKLIVDNDYKNITINIFIFIENILFNIKYVDNKKKTSIHCNNVLIYAYICIQIYGN